jgi:hypothetical protein
MNIGPDAGGFATSCSFATLQNIPSGKGVVIHEREGLQTYSSKICMLPFLSAFATVIKHHASMTWSSQLCASYVHS